MLELLTKKELEVLSLIAKGYSNDEITNKLFITQATFSTHQRSIYQKFQLLGNANLKSKSVMRLNAALIYLKEKGLLKGN